MFQFKRDLTTKARLRSPTAMKHDSLYAIARQRIGDFAFDEDVAEVFPDMIARSVPGYASILSMIEQLSARFAQPATRVYDLGCSLGAATLLMRNRIPASCIIHAVDNSAAMVRRLEAKLASAADGNDKDACSMVEVHESDIRNFPMSNASFVVLNLTLQFVPPEERASILQAACDATVDGGALLLSEKVCFDDADQQELMTKLHHEFKRAHGYSDLEIAQKRTALENRLITETLQEHVSRLREVGYQTVTPWFQCFNFVSILAVK